MMKNSSYCGCENVISVHTDIDDFWQWDVCNTCNKEIEDSRQDVNGDFYPGD